MSSKPTMTVNQFGFAIAIIVALLLIAAVSIAHYHDKNMPGPKDLTLEEKYEPGVVHRDVIGGYNSVIYCNPKCTVWKEAVTVTIGPSTEEMLRKLHEEMHAEKIPPSEILK